jgi:hypothetical protein
VNFLIPVARCRNESNDSTIEKTKLGPRTTKKLQQQGNKKMKEIGWIRLVL